DALHLNAEVGFAREVSRRPDRIHGVPPTQCGEPRHGHVVPERSPEGSGVSVPDARIRRRASRDDGNEVVDDLSFVAERKEEPILHQRPPQVGTELFPSVVRLRLLETSLSDQASVLLEPKDGALERVATLMCN